MDGCLSKVKRIKVTNGKGALLLRWAILRWLRPVAWRHGSSSVIRPFAESIIAGISYKIHLIRLISEFLPLLNPLFLSPFSLCSVLFFGFSFSPLLFLFSVTPRSATTAVCISVQRTLAGRWSSSCRWTSGGRFCPPSRCRSAEWRRDCPPLWSQIWRPPFGLCRWPMPMTIWQSWRIAPPNSAPIVGKHSHRRQSRRTFAALRAGKEGNEHFANCAAYPRHNCHFVSEWSVGIGTVLALANSKFVGRMPSLLPLLLVSVSLLLL